MRLGVYIGVGLLVIVAVAVGLRTAPSWSRAASDSAAEDEQLLRQVWKVPGRVPITAMSSNPQTGGFYGREGLRIYATFQFRPGELRVYRSSFRPSDWRPLPLPTSVTGLPRGTAELDSLRGNGRYLCLISAWTGNTPAATSTWLPLGDPEATGGFHRHTIAVTDERQDVLYVLYQNHY